MYAEGEALYDKIRPTNEQDGIKAYCILYRWFTEVSGLGMAAQARRLIQPEAPKSEEQLSEYIDNWCERVRRLEAHGSKYGLSALYKVTALRQLMVRKAKDHFEIWQGDIQAKDDEGFKELFNEFKDYARRKKLDHNATHGTTSMDIGSINDHSGDNHNAHHDDHRT